MNEWMNECHCLPVKEEKNAPTNSIIIRISMCMDEEQWVNLMWDAAAISKWVTRMGPTPKIPWSPKSPPYLRKVQLWSIYRSHTWHGHLTRSLIIFQRCSTRFKTHFPLSKLRISPQKPTGADSIKRPGGKEFFKSLIWANQLGNMDGIRSL